MPNIFFTADTHFGHSRIIQYCNRPFTSCEEMEEAIIQRTNEVVKKGDILYHLGDVAWSSYDWNNYVDRLNTKQLYLIWGNHDKHMRKLVDRGDFSKFIWAKEMKTLQLPVEPMRDHQFVLCHYAMRTWPGKHRGAVQLYGHSHGKLPGVERQLDVGVDCWDYAPVSIEQVWKKMKNTEYTKYE